MESLIGLVNRIQRACTVLGDHGGEGMSLWEALPSVAVVGGQVSTASRRFLYFTPFLFLYCFQNARLAFRVPGNLLFWKAWSEGTSCLVDPVSPYFCANVLFINFVVLHCSL